MLSAAGIRADPHLSVSQLTTWLQCPRKYRFQYVERLPWPAVPSALVFGSAMHAAIAHFHEASLQGHGVAVPELQDVFTAAWRAEAKPIELRRGETAEGLAALAAELLKVVERDVTPAEVVGVEEPFRIDLAADLPPLVGFIDLIERRGERVVIVEYKTAAQRYSAQRVRDDLQLSAYALAGLQMDLPGVDEPRDLGLEFRVLLKAKQPSLDVRTTERSAGQLDELRDTAASIQRAIDTGAFPRNRGWQCSGCPFRGPCEA